MSVSTTGELYHLSLDSVEEDSNIPWFSLVQNLTPDEFQMLKNIFSEHTESSLNQEEFMNAICLLYGNSKYSVQSILLFKEIASQEGKTRITWSDFLNFLLRNLNEKPKSSIEFSLLTIDAVPELKRESIIKIVEIETEKYFCYAILAKHGRITLYDGCLNFLTTYHTIMTREDITRSDDERRRRNRWITDAIFCPDQLVFIVTNTARSLMIYEASGLHHIPLYLILGSPNIIECLDYKPGDSYLFMGDTNGEITSFQFHQLKIGLFRKKHNDNINLFYWAELPNEGAYVTVKYYGKVHSDSVQHLDYCNKSNTLFSCSRDPKKSILRKYLDNRKKTIVFQMMKGARIFARSVMLKLLISGSENGIIRIWNIVLNSKPVAILNEHHCDIKGLQILEKQQIFISLCKDAILKIWDLKEFNCIQTIKLKFPCLGVQGKTIEWGRNSIYRGPKRQRTEKLSIKTDCFDMNFVTETKQFHNEEAETKYETSNLWERSNILITCCNYIANISLKFNDPDIELSFNQPVLPPPPLQNSVLIPSSWMIPHVVDDLTSKSSLKENVTDESIKDLDFILKKNLLDEHGQRSDINYKIAILERKKLEMKKFVSQGAPYLALDLYDIEDLTLSNDLPVINRRKNRNFVEKTKQILSNASARDQIFSEASSSRSNKSSRSSIMEFPS